MLNIYSVRKEMLLEISIHYMLLVQGVNQVADKMILESFNTLYVVGSINHLLLVLKGLMFQYIICCWFN